MKVKLNLDKQSIKTFLVEHTEKIVFGVVVVCFVLIVYSAVGRDTFDRSPEQLRDAARVADEHIERTDPSDAESVPVVAGYGPAVMNWRDNPIQVAPYEHTKRWDPPIFDPQGPRDDPALLVVEELRGSVGSGAFSVKPAGATPAGATSAGTKTQGRRWVVLTGLVDYEAQAKAFERCFRNAEFKRGAPEDELNYVAFVVERAEVDGSEAVEALDWSKNFQVSKRTIAAALATWSEKTDDVVDKKFVEESLTFPLGPLLGRQWGPEVAHPGQIPLKTVTEKGMPRETPKDVPAADDGGPFFQTPTGEPDTQSEDPAQVAETDPEASDGLRLFRFFDFEVEPGRQYRYRVQLIVRNPNHEVPARYLVNPESAKEGYVWSEFSEPTEVISVPYDSRVFAVDVKPLLRIKDSPSGTVKIQNFVEATGETVSKEFPIAAGKVMNFYDVKPADDASASVDFLTDAVALDLWGGDSSYARSELTTPGEMLVLGRDGRLVWHNEFDDAVAYEASVTSEAGPNGSARPGSGGRNDGSTGQGATTGDFGEIYQ